jgi:DeoR/GlpR family transcriptional regulator of sugar metabolism
MRYGLAPGATSFNLAPGGVQPARRRGPGHRRLSPGASGDGVIAARRRQEIQQLVETAGYVEARLLAAKLGVDVSTIRRDLDALSRQGAVQRTHGGALPAPSGESLDVPYALRRNERVAQKQAIAAHAASLVADGDSLVLDSGSTTYALAEAIARRRRLTVATNDLRIAHHLAEVGCVRLMVTGGQLLGSVFTLVGPGALHSLAGMQVDWAFLGADAVDAEAGLTNRNTLEVSLKVAMLTAAARKVLLADSEKFGRRALAAVAPLSAFDHLVTDAGLAPPLRARYGDHLVCVPVARDDRGPEGPVARQPRRC